MKTFAWNVERNELLKRLRGVSFEDVLFFYTERGHILDVIEHPNQDKYDRQRILIIQMNDYAYLVPLVETETEILLKTIIPSRKVTRRYRPGENG